MLVWPQVGGEEGENLICSVRGKCTLVLLLAQAPPLSLEVEPSSTFGCFQDCARFGYPSASRKTIGVPHEDAAQLSQRPLGRRIGCAADARQSRHRGAACASIE